MNKNQRILVKLLNSAIRKGNTLDINWSSVNWNYIISESKHHNIYPLLYPVINGIKDPDIIDNTLKEKWKHDALNTAIDLSNQFIQLGKILREFTNAKIPVLVLKGMILRNYYPIPDLRTMSDADILVQNENIDKAKILLVRMGYKQAKVSTPAHLSFIHKLFSPIEVHWTLADNRYIGDISYFESQVWINSITKEVSSIPLLCLCNEDFLIHLCIHMAVHIKYGGFGLRQLCDLVLFLENEFTKINWKSFRGTIKYLGVEKFTATIFNVCKELFDMQIPDELKNISVNKSEILMLINDIFDSGVFGRSSLNRVFANELLNADSDITLRKKDSFYKKSVINIICPPINSLSDVYSYAKKNKILTPIAWIHHFFTGFFHKDYSLSDKINFLFLSTPTYKRRSKLIKKLEL